jgi:serine/threonine protein phosphatase PrpC
MIAEKHFAGRQCLGKRSEQEDSYAFSELPKDGGLLVVVADGMGGHAAGSQASELAVRKFVAAVHRAGESLTARMSEALEIANNSIAEAIDADPDHLEGMGTTLVAAALTPAGLLWISIGDSPLYLWREGTLRRLNEDHSYRPVLREMVSKGEVSEDQAAVSSLRNRLRAALIGGEMALIDAPPKPFPLLPGDVVLACSDGVQTLTDLALTHAVSRAAQGEAVEVSTALLRAVLDADKPKQDNATVAVLKPPDDFLASPSPTPQSTSEDDTATRQLSPHRSEPAATP